MLWHLLVLDFFLYEAEMKRRDLAQEKLSKAKEEWYEAQVERKNRLQKLREEVEDAYKDMEDTNNALHAFRTLKDEIEKQRRKEPNMNNYYKPPGEMKTYMNITAGTIGLGGGWLLSRLVL